MQQITNLSARREIEQQKFPVHPNTLKPWHSIAPEPRCAHRPPAISANPAAEAPFPGFGRKASYSKDAPTGRQNYRCPAFGGWPSNGSFSLFLKMAPLQTQIIRSISGDRPNVYNSKWVLCFELESVIKATDHLTPRHQTYSTGCRGHGRLMPGVPKVIIEKRKLKRGDSSSATFIPRPSPRGSG